MVNRNEIILIIIALGLIVSAFIFGTSHEKEVVETQSLTDKYIVVEDQFESINRCRYVLKIHGFGHVYDYERIYTIVAFEPCDTYQVNDTLNIGG